MTADGKTRSALQGPPNGARTEAAGAQQREAAKPAQALRRDAAMAVKQIAAE